MSQTIEVPESIPFSKVRAFLADLGIEARDVRELNLGMDGVRAEVIARDNEGRMYLTPGGDIAMHTIAIKLDRAA